MQYFHIFLWPRSLIIIHYHYLSSWTFCDGRHHIFFLFLATNDVMFWEIKGEWAKESKMKLGKRNIGQQQYKQSAVFNNHYYWGIFSSFLFSSFFSHASLCIFFIFIHSFTHSLGRNVLCSFSLSSFFDWQSKWLQGNFKIYSAPIQIVRLKFI